MKFTLPYRVYLITASLHITFYFDLCINYLVIELAS